MNKKIFMRRLRSVLRGHGLSWTKLTRDASQIVVFGSASAGFEGSTSDIDLLCIGKGSRFKSAVLDVVWKSEVDVHQKGWLGSELGNHIARYGVWIWGKDNWSKPARVSPRAITFKRRLISARARFLEAGWATLRTPYRQKHVVKLRRDVQRLSFLMRHEGVPTTPQLDQEWKQLVGQRSNIAAALESIGGDDLVTRKQRRKFQPFWKCITVPLPGRRGERRLQRQRPRRRRH